MKTKRLYQSPQTRRDEVELEDGFCGSIVQNDPDNGFVQTTEHEVNTIDADNGLNSTGDNWASSNDWK